MSIARAQVLRDARALIADPAQWTREAIARNGSGAETELSSVEAVCWCMGGAIVVAAEKAGVDSEPILQSLCRQLGVHAVYEFNDHRPHGDILAALDWAIVLAGARA